MITALLLTLYQPIARAAPPALVIAQAAGTHATFDHALCERDALELVEQMRARPADFDLSKVRVLAMGLVTIARRDWVMHFAVFDGAGFVYDAAFAGSRVVPPVAIREYLSAVANRHHDRKPSEFRAIEVEAFARAFAAGPLEPFHLFGAGMPGMEPETEEVTDAEWALLAPLQKSTRLVRWLEIEQHEPQRPKARPVQLGPLFASLPERPALWQVRGANDLFALCRRADLALPEAVAALCLTDIPRSEARRYLDLLDHAYAPATHLNPRFDLAEGLVARGAPHLEVWRAHPVKQKVRIECGSFLAIVSR